jgi:hypothetical protein
MFQGPTHSGYSFVSLIEGRSNGPKQNSCGLFGEKKFEDIFSLENLKHCNEEITSFRLIDRLCGLVVRVPGYRSRGPGNYKKKK